MLTNVLYAGAQGHSEGFFALQDFDEFYYTVGPTGILL
jgi:hypothetical protein